MMRTRVLRSATSSLKRSFSNGVSSSDSSSDSVEIVTKKAKKTVKVEVANEDGLKWESISYYDSLKTAERALELPKEFEEAHHPDFVEGLKFLIKKEPFFHQFIVKAPFPSFLISKDEPKKDDHYYFESLISGIISQQISGKAAESIKNKLIDNLSTDSRLPSAKIFNDQPIENLRLCGLSERKLQYIKLIASAFLDKVLSKEIIENLSDDELYNMLIEFKGIGPWSVVMFLLFSLKRLNTFTHTDLGVLRGASKYLMERSDLLKEVKRNTLVKTRKKEAKRRNWVAVDEECLVTLSKEFEPYKSCLMLVFWRISDIHIEALET